MIISYIKRQLNIVKAKKRWRKNNPQNYTRIRSIFDQSIVQVGNYTYGTINISSSKSIGKVFIGHFCSIADDVLFMVNNEHFLHYISTYPFKNKLMSGESEATTKGDIIVKDDVWIGNNVTIMSGVTIEQGAVIGTGAVVTKNVPAYSIVGGVPAKVIGMRFPQEIIDKLIGIDYSQIDKSFVEQHKEQLYEPISVNSDLDWLPRKS